MSAAAARSSKFASKSNETHYKDFKIPESPSDFFSTYKKKSGITDNDANEIYISVFPDMRALFIMCCYHAHKFYPSIALKGHAKVSPPTVIMYFLTVAYAYLFFNDHSISGNPSRFALSVYAHDEFKDYLLGLLEYPVPSFIKTWADNLCYTTLEQNASILFCLSAAGFSHRHDFGRFIPMSFLTELHDIICASNKASAAGQTATDDTVWIKFLAKTLYSCKLHKSDTATTNVVPAHLLGYFPNSTTATTGNYVSNRLIQMLESVFNPFLSRTYARRDSFSRINLETVECSHENVNPYHVLFSLVDGNTVEMNAVLEDVRDAIKGIVPCSSDLAGLLSSASGIGILTHGYSNFGLPTWNADKTPLSTAVTTLADIKPAQYAAALLFKQLTPWTNFTAVPFPAHGTDAANANLDLVLRSRDAAPTDATGTMPLDSSQLKFDVKRDQYPHVTVLHPKEKAVENAHLATLCGLVIESEEIDGALVPHIRPEANIGDLNNEILSSCLSLLYVQTGTSFHTSAHRTSHCVLPRRVTDAPAFKTAIVLHDFARLRIPQAAAATALATPPTAATLPGLHLWKKVTTFRHALQYIGSELTARHNKGEVLDDAAVDAPVNVERARVLVWSPYRYVSLKNRKPTLGAGDYDNVYMLTNLRTIFGTHAPVVGVSHAFVAVPQ